ncbi:hypothetical protein HZC34_06905 [Candidatus Saganbacteria bacterium]|nr:hypothetical protein [Candidatus Saganbacteria bacterium]
MKLKRIGVFFFAVFLLVFSASICFGASNYHGGWSSVSSGISTGVGVSKAHVLSGAAAFMAGGAGKAIFIRGNYPSQIYHNRSLSTSETVKDVKAVDATNVCVLTNNAAYMSTDGGASYTRKASSLSGIEGFSRAFLLSASEGYFVVSNNGSSTNFLFSTAALNDGSELTYLSDRQIGGADKLLNGLWIFSGTSGVIVGKDNTSGNSLIYRASVDITIVSNWSKVYDSSSEGTGLNSVYFIDTATGYAVGNGGAILKTTDGGATWTAQTSGSTQILNDVYFLNSSVGWASGDNGTILRTVDGGTNWASIGPGGSSILGGVSGSSANNVWIAGTSRDGEVIYHNNVPVVTQVSTSAVVGTSGTFTFTGSNFEPETTFTISGTGAAASSITVVSSISATATLTISSSATTGARSVTATNPDGSTGTGTDIFTIISAAGAISGITNPSILTVTPEVLAITSTNDVTISGEGFQSGATVAFNPSTGIQSTVKSISSNTITLLTTVGATATSGAVAITVTNPDGGGNTKNAAFVLTAAGVIAPTITSISPGTITRGSSESVTIIGTGFLAGASIAFSGSGVVAGTITSLSTTEIKVPVTCDPSSGIGLRNLTITNTNGGVAVKTSALTVVSATTADNPVITSVVEKNVSPGVIDVTINGSNFPYPLSGKTLSFDFGSGIAVASYTVLSSAQIVATITISSAGSVTGSHDFVLTVKDASGTATGTGSLANAITVVASAANTAAFFCRSPWDPSVGGNLKIKIYVPEAGTYTIAAVSPASNIYKKSFTFVAGVNYITIDKDAYQFPNGIYVWRIINGGKLLSGKLKLAVVHSK